MSTKVSTFLAALPNHQPRVEALAISVGYNGPQDSDIEPQYVLKRRIHKNFRTPLSETEKDIANLLTWQEGWDGYDAPEPNPASINRACSWIRSMYKDVRKVLWLEPLVTADEEGDVVFEWWRGYKKLTVYISPEAVEYVRVERLENSSEIEDGSITTSKKVRALWNWLLT